MMQTTALLFDLDGTLIDALPDLVEGVNALMRRYELAALSREQISEFIGKGARHLIERAFEARKKALSEKELDAMVEEYVAIMLANDGAHTRVFDGVPEAIEHLRARGIQVALVTNKVRVMTERVIERLGCAEWFDAVVCGDDTTCPKPAPDMLHLACRKLGVEASESVMVGYSRNDALAARAAGMRVYLVNTGYNEGEPIDRWARAQGFSTPFDSIYTLVTELVAP